MALTLADRIDPVAIYAATVSTCVLIWQIFVWLRTGPKLKVSASANMKTFGGFQQDDNAYVLIKVRNVGTQQTTITHVVGFSYRSRWAHLRRKPSGTFVVNHSVAAYPIPYVLGAGQTFMSMIVQDQSVEKQSRETLLFVGVIHSHYPLPAPQETTSRRGEDPKG
jgi:hypothetical protein